MGTSFHFTCMEGTLSASPTPFTEPRTTVSIFQRDILVKASTAPRAILALKQVSAGGLRLGRG